MAVGRFLKLASQEPARPVPAGPSARDKLAIAIAEHQAAERAVAESEARIADLERRNWAARDALEAAETRLEEVRRQHAHHLGNPVSPAPVMTVREAREAITEASDTLETIRAALTIAREAHTSIKDRPQHYTSSSVDQAVAEAVAADPAIDAICRRYLEARRTFIDLWSVMNLLTRESALPTEFKDIDRIDPALFWYGPKPAEWIAAFEALRTDPAAPLPVLKN